jgi:hypothetical protein
VVPYFQTNPYCLLKTRLDFCFAFAVFWFGIHANNAHEQERWCPVDREQGRVTLQKQLILWVMSCWIRITLG